MSIDADLMPTCRTLQWTVSVILTENASGSCPWRSWPSVAETVTVAKLHTLNDEIHQTCFLMFCHFVQFSTTILIVEEHVWSRKIVLGAECRLVDVLVWILAAVWHSAWFPLAHLISPLCCGRQTAVVQLLILFSSSLSLSPDNYMSVRFLNKFINCIFVNSLDRVHGNSKWDELKVYVSVKGVWCAGMFCLLTSDWLTMQYPVNSSLCGRGGCGFFCLNGLCRVKCCISNYYAGRIKSVIVAGTSSLLRQIVTAVAKLFVCNTSNNLQGPTM